MNARRDAEHKRRIELEAEERVLERVLRGTAGVDTGAGVRAYIEGALQAVREAKAEQLARWKP